MIDPALLPFHAMFRKFKHETAHLTPSAYHQCTPSTGLTVDGALGWNTLRVTPFVVPNRATITRIGAEVVTAGAAGSVFRLGIYADNGRTFPAALVLDAGTIPGDAAAVAELTISQKLKPGLYWVGGAIQGGTSGTQPAIRAMTGIQAGGTMLNNGWTIPPGTQTNAQGFSHFGSVTGALPSTWNTTVSPSTTAPRVFVKVAA